MADRAPPEPAEDDESGLSDIGQVYHINADDILGSGQFGIVFGGQLQLAEFNLTPNIIITLYNGSRLPQANPPRCRCQGH